MFSRLSSNLLAGLSTSRCLPKSIHPSLWFPAPLSQLTITQPIRFIANKPDYKPETSSFDYKSDNSKSLDDPKRTSPAYQAGIPIANYNPEKSTSIFHPNPAKISDRNAKLRDLFKFYFEIGSTTFIFYVMESNKDKEIILALNEFNKEIKYQRHIWVSILAAKILLDKLKAYQVKATDNLSVAHFTDTESNHSISLKLVNDRKMLLKLEAKHLVEFNKVSNRKRGIWIQIEAAQLLFHRLKDCCDVIQSYEGRMQRSNQARDVLFSKSCMDQENEYIVQLLVSEPEMRHLGDMFLVIESKKRLNENIISCIIIRSHGAQLLLNNIEEILRAYERLKPSLLESDSSTLSDPKTLKAAYVLEDEQSPKVMHSETQEYPPKFVDRPALTETETLKSGHILEEPQDSLKFVEPKNLDLEINRPKEAFDQCENDKVEEKQGSILKLGLGILLLVFIFLW